MSVVAIVQARQNSTRFPEKVFADIEGYSMLEHVMARVASARSVERVVVAIPLKDEKLWQYCKERKWTVYPGNEHDVLKRYYGAARAYRAKTVVRVTSDCPLLDPTVIDLLVAKFKSGAYDLACMDLDDSFTWPHGSEVEVMSYDCLVRMHQTSTDAYEREHVSLPARNNPDQYDMVNMGLAVDWSRHHYTVDTPEDLERVRAIFQHYKKPDVTTAEAVRFLEA